MDRGNRPFTTGKKLIKAAEEAGLAVPEEMLKNCARSIRARVEAVIAANGGLQDCKSTDCFTLEMYCQSVKTSRALEGIPYPLFLIITVI